MSFIHNTHHNSRGIGSTLGASSVVEQPVHRGSAGGKIKLWTTNQGCKWLMAGNSKGEGFSSPYKVTLIFVPYLSVYLKYSSPFLGDAQVDSTGKPCAGCEYQAMFLKFCGYSYSGSVGTKNSGKNLTQCFQNKIFFLLPIYQVNKFESSQNMVGFKADFGPSV